MRRDNPPVKWFRDREGDVCLHEFVIHKPCEREKIGGVFRPPRAPKMRPRIRRREWLTNLSYQCLELVLVQLHAEPPAHLVSHFTPTTTSPFHLTKQGKGCDERPIVRLSRLCRFRDRATQGLTDSAWCRDRCLRVPTTRAVPIRRPTTRAPHGSFGATRPPGMATPETGLLPQHAHMWQPYVSVARQVPTVSLSEHLPVADPSNLQEDVLITLESAFAMRAPVLPARGPMWRPRRPTHWIVWRGHAVCAMRILSRHRVKLLYVAPTKRSNFVAHLLSSRHIGDQSASAGRC